MPVTINNPQSSGSAPVPTYAQWDPRTLILGDSYLQMGYANNANVAYPSGQGIGFLYVYNGTLYVVGTNGTLTGNTLSFIGCPTTIYYANTGSIVTTTSFTNEDISYATFTFTASPLKADLTANSNVLTAPAFVSGTAIANRAYVAPTWAAITYVPYSCVMSGGNSYYTVAGGTATAGNSPTGTSTFTGSDGIVWIYVSSSNSSTVSSGVNYWYFVSTQRTTDSNCLNWINAFSGKPFEVVANYALTSSRSDQHLASIGRLKTQTPPSSYSNVHISLGMNGITGAGVTSNNSYAATIAIVNKEADEVMQIADQIKSTGVVYIHIPVGGITYSGGPSATQTQNTTKAIAYYRRRLYQLAATRTYRIQFVDIYSMTIDGTSANGLTVANYSGDTNPTIHVETFGLYNIGKALAAQIKNNTINQWLSNTYLKSLSVLDDTTTRFVPRYVNGETLYGTGHIRHNGSHIYRLASYTTGVSATTAAIPGTLPAIGSGAGSFVDGNMNWSLVAGAAGILNNAAGTTATKNVRDYSNGLACTSGSTIVNSNGNVYLAGTTATTNSAVGPIGTTTNTAGGISWSYLGPYAIWRSGVAYSFGDIRQNNYNLYKCIVAGTSASSNPDTTLGPVGTGNYIQDGTVVWTYVGVSPDNLLSNPTLAGSGVVSTGTAPTDWTVGAITGTWTTTAGTTITVKDANNNYIPGLGWTIVNSSGGATDTITLSTNTQSSLYLSLYGGNYYQYRFTVVSTGTNSGLSSIVGNIAGTNTSGPVSGAPTFEVLTMTTGNNTNTGVNALSTMQTGDSYDVISFPFYVPSDAAITRFILNIVISSRVLGGVVNIQICNPSIYPVPNPYLPPG